MFATTPSESILRPNFAARRSLALSVIADTKADKINRIRSPSYSPVSELYA